MLTGICIGLVAGGLVSFLTRAVFRLCVRRTRNVVMNQLQRLESELTVLLRDNRHDCKAPTRMIGEIRGLLSAARKTLGLPETFLWSVEIYRIREAASTLGQADGLIKALGMDVYPLILRWREADSNLLRAMEPLLVNYMTGRQPLISDEEMRVVWRKLDAIREVAAQKPRVGLELLTALVEDLARTPAEPVGKPPSK